MTAHKKILCRTLQMKISSMIKNMSQKILNKSNILGSRYKMTTKLKKKIKRSSKRKSLKNLRAINRLISL